ncbi:hypothetical protein Dsin_022606 [Dipteronia sinensis]|uniref:Uncharacterized protein n=1 Tax=Dipteronia sinensis TaxID=43782 RepID=A0AAE0A3B3_9ROSI|nr:hypothetical protein Dsin_022606 [Dipteronia sinensis]
MGIWDDICSKTDSIKRNAPDRSRAAVSKIHDKLQPHLPDEETRFKIAADLLINSARFAFREGVKFVPEELKELKDKVKKLEKELSDSKKSVEKLKDKGIYLSSYDYSCAAVTIIHDAVKVNTVDKLYPYLPDVETRSEIATNLAKKTATVAVREGAKLVPGGSTVYDIVSRSIPWEKKAKEYKDLKDFKDKVSKMQSEQDRMKNELNDCKRLLKQHEVHRLIMELKTNKTLGLSRKPEDVIRLFTKPEDAYRFLFTKPEVTGKQYLDDLRAPGVKPK